jgi:ubiquinone/menaquinone biosynthesis C-methylase UbiE
MKRDIWYERYRKKHSFLYYYLEIVSRRKLVKTLRGIKGSKLEIGCGRAIISDHIGKNDMVIASDLSKSNVKIAKQKHSHIYDFVVCEAKALPFRKKSFKVVFSQGLYEHFNDDDLEILIKESRRVCEVTIIDIPLKGYKFLLLPQGGSWGERLLPKDFWIKKLVKFGEVKYETYNIFFIPKMECECVFKIEH